MIKHYVYSAFNWGQKPLDENWTNKRLDIYNNLTIKSIKCQNVDVEPVLLFNSKFKYAIERAKHLLEPQGVNIVDQTIHSLANQKMLDDIENYDWVYYTRLDSDDVYSNKAMEIVQKVEPQENMVMKFCQGYQYDIINKRLGVWGFNNGPFTTVPMKKETFKHSESSSSIALFKHNKVMSKFKIVKNLSHQHYCVIKHDSNDSTKWMGKNFSNPGLWIKPFKELFPEVHADWITGENYNKWKKWDV